MSNGLPRYVDWAQRARKLEHDNRHLDKQLTFVRAQVEGLKNTATEVLGRMLHTLPELKASDERIVRRMRSQLKWAEHWLAYGGKPRHE